MPNIDKLLAQKTSNPNSSNIDNLLNQTKLNNQVVPGRSGVTAPTNLNSSYDTGIGSGHTTEDINYNRGELQPRLDKVANAVPRLISKVGIEVAKTPGYLYAIGSAMSPDTTLAESLNNAWLNTLESADNSVKEQFAIYKPKSVIEGNLWDNLTSTSFYTDEGVDGLGFLLGMMAPGFALRGANLAGKTTNALTKVGMNSAKAANWGKNVELGTSTLINSALESAAEAKGLVDQLRPELQKQVEQGLISQEDANKQLGEAGRNSFLQNMALITGPNFLMNKNILGRFIPDKTALSEVTDELGNLIKPTQLKGIALANQYAKNIGKNIFSEGFVEEGGQFAIEDYNKKLALGQTDSPFLQGIIESYADALTTTEGQKSIFLGGLLGGGASALSNIGKAQKDYEKQSVLYKLINDNFNGFNKNISELYDDKGNINPIKKQEFVQNILKEHLSSQIKDVYATLDNKEAYDYISNQEFTKFALPYLQQENGLDLLNQHIDKLSKQLIENEKQSRGVDNTLDETKYITDLKLKARKLQKAFDSINTGIKVNLENKDQVEVKQFENLLKQAAFQETSKQLFITDRINKLNLELAEYNLGLGKDIPQNKFEVDKISKQIEKYTEALNESIEKYDKIFDQEEIKKGFNAYTKVEKIKDEQTPKQEEKEVSIDIKNFAERVKNGEVLSSEEDIKYYTENLTEIDKEVQNLKKQEIKETNKNSQLKTINESEVNERAVVKSSPKSGKKALTPFKSENGWDGTTFFINNEKYGIKSINDNKYTLKNIKDNSEIVLTAENLEQFANRELSPSQDRFYSFVRNNNVTGYKLLPVTKKSNPEIYEYLLAIQDNELDFENTNARQNDKEDSIYLVVVDPNGNMIKVDNQLVFSYMTRPERVEKGEIISKEKEALIKLRDEILTLSNGSFKTLEVTDKSTGVPQFEPKVDGQRIGKSVIGTIYDNSNEIQLEIITQAAEDNYGFLSNGQIATIGKLYAIKGDLAIDLIPRKLDNREAYKLAKLLEAKLNGQSNTKDIEKLIYYGEGTGLNKYSVFVKEGILYLGENITFTKETFNQDIVEQWLLNNKRVNFNNSITLNKEFSTPFNPEFKGTYQDYLVLGDNPLFGTDLKSKGDIQFRNQYLIYNPVLTQDTLKTTQLEVNTEVKEETIEPIPQPGKYERAARTPKSKPGDFNRLTSRSKDKNLLTKEEENWFISQFPNIPILLVKGLIDNKSLGRFLAAGKVLLSDQATIGTLYHEAFHTVTQLYLSTKEVNTIYKEASKQSGLTDELELEELLAEDFADYKKTGKILGNRPQRNTIFRKLLNFLKDLFRLEAKDIQDIYRRLDKGFYKNSQPLSKSRFTSLDRALQGKSEKFTKDLLDGIDAIFFKTLHLNNKTEIDSFQYVDAALNKAHDIITGIVKDENYPYEVSEETQDYVYDNWEEIASKWLERMNSLGAKLKDFDITKNYQEGIIEKETEEVNPGEDKTRSGEAYQESNLQSTKAQMFNSTKFLIRSLVQKQPNGSDKLNDLGLPATVEFNKTYNFLLKELVGLGSNYSNYYNKIQELSKTRPEFQQLLNKILPPEGAVSLHQLMLQNQFLQDFNKNKAVSYVTIYDGDKIYQIDATKQVIVDRIKEAWQATVKIKSEIDKEGRLISNVKNEGKNIDYLERLGITFSPETLQSLDKNKDFNEAAQAVRNYIKANDNNVSLLFTDKNISSRLTTLALLEAEYTQDAIELSYMNSEGETVYSIGYNNFLSNITNTINRVNNLTELYAELPHLKSVTTEGSLWLKELFNPNTGNKIPGVQINLSLKDGVKDKDSDTGISTRSLTIGDKLVQDINGTLLNGLTNYIRASDKSTEHTVNLSEYGKNQKLPIPIEEFEDGFDIKELKDIFNGYFKSEFKRIALFDIQGLGKNIDQYQKVGDKWTTFSFLSANLKKELYEQIKELKTQDLASIDLTNELDKIAESYFDKVSPEVIKFFDSYLFEQLKQFDENQINSKQGISDELQKYDLTTLTRALIVTDMINSVEQTKLYIGDMAFYKDLFKRTSALTGTKESCRVDSDLNNWLNNPENAKRLDKKEANGNINVAIFNDSNQQSNYVESYKKALIKSGISSEEAENLLKAYLEMDEGDAQGWITLDEFREFMIRLGKWDNLKEKSWSKLQANKELGNEELVYFLSLKAQYFGPQKYNDLFAPAFHKYSLMPLVPQLVKSTNLEVLLNTMTKEQVGYGLFKSGSKVGTPVNSKGEANNFYTNVNSGEINTKDWTKQIISYKYLGLQQKSSEPHAKVIFGTQTRKLLFSNLFESGDVNTDFEGAKDLLSQYSNIIKDKIKVEKDKLIKELGLNKDTLDSEDVTKIIELLQQEAKDRALPDNLIESLQSEIDVNGNKTLKYKFDSMVNKPKIDSMLMSIINSRLIRQKINGDALVQGASSGFEAKGDRKAGSNDTLKFYTNEGPNGSTTHAECMVAMNKNYKPLLDKYGSLDALNQAIADNKVDVRLLQMIGYRIPTQGLNSIDMLQIKKFLPETSGTLIILPTDIVAKSGGDYDIDKMNVFRPAMDKEGNYIETPDNKLIEMATQVLQHPSNFIALTTPNSTKILTDLVDEVRWIEHKNEKPEYTGDVTKYRKEYQDELKNIKYIDQLKLWFKTKTFQKFMLAKDMIGIAAIQNTHHILSQLTGLTLNKTYIVLDRNGKPIERNRVISFEHNRGNNNTIDIGKTFDVENKNKISEVISQIINATVDAAKDPFLFDLNMTLETLSTYTYLVRIGVPFDTVVYFMKQPIINNYLNELSIKQSMFLGLSKSTAKKEAQAIVKQLYKTDEFFDLESKVYNAEELKNNLFLENQNSEEFKANQLHILNKFLEYQDQSSMLSDAMKSTNYDTAGLGKNYGVQFLKQQLKNKVAKDNFVNGIDKINDSFIGAFDQIDFSLKAFGQFYDIYSNPEIAKSIQSLINKINPFKDDDKIKLRTLLENDFIQYITQNYSYNNISELKTKLFNTQSVAKELLAIKLNKTNPLNDNLIIKELFPLLNQSKTGIDNIKIYARKYDTFQANQLTEAFKELQELGKQANEDKYKETGNPEDLNTPTLAEKLMDVGIIQSGLANSPITYLGIIPFEYYNELVKKGFQKFDKKNGAEDLYKFQALFLRENPYGIAKKGWIYGKNFSIESKDNYEKPNTEETKPVELIENSDLFDSNLPKINIYAGTGENAELSNFAFRPFNYVNGLTFEDWLSIGKFNSVEGAFQAQKIAYTSDATSEEDIENKKILEKLRIVNGVEAKALGRKIKGLYLEDWNSDSSLIMKDLLKQSFEQNPKALEKLLATGNAELTHTQDKGKWSIEFPKLLMEIRQELRNNSENISQSEENSVSLQDWNTFKNDILKKDPEMSFEIWNSLTEEEREKIKTCL